MEQNFTQQLQSFINAAQPRFGNNLDPSTVVRSMIGNSCSSPRQALEMMFKTGRISQEQFNMYSRML